MRAHTEVLTAADIMVSPVRCAQSAEPLVKAAHRLSKRGWSGAPVVDDQGKIVGMLSEADVLKGLASAAYHDSPQPELVRDVMTTPVDCANPNTDLFALVGMLTNSGHKRVVVVKDDHPVGIVTRKDIMRALLRLCERRYGQIETMDAVAATEGTHNPFSH